MKNPAHGDSLPGITALQASWGWRAGAGAPPGGRGADRRPQLSVPARVWGRLAVGTGCAAVVRLGPHAQRHPAGEAAIVTVSSRSLTPRCPPSRAAQREKKLPVLARGCFSALL